MSSFREPLNNPPLCDNKKGSLFWTAPPMNKWNLTCLNASTTQSCKFPPLSSAILPSVFAPCGLMERRPSVHRSTTEAYTSHVTTEQPLQVLISRIPVSGSNGVGHITGTNSRNWYRSFRRHRYCFSFALLSDGLSVRVGTLPRHCELSILTMVNEWMFIPIVLLDKSNTEIRKCRINYIDRRSWG